MSDYCLIDQWCVDFTAGVIKHQSSGEQRRLGEFQIKLLRVLAENAGKTLTREELHQLVWERRIIGNNSLPNAIHALRAALDDEGKERKIIKTVPKQGYLLEAEYCQFIPPPDLDDIQVHPFFTEAELSAEESANYLSPQPDGSQDDAPPLHRRENARLWRAVIICQVLLVVVLLGWASGVRFPSASHHLEVRDTAIYSHINLQERVGNQAPGLGDELLKLLGPTWSALEPLLKEQQIEMEVVYDSSSTALNYTMTLRNRCGQRQLAMTILNWRLDPKQLNALIYRESERKVYEMAHCIR